VISDCWATATTLGTGVVGDIADLVIVRSLIVNGTQAVSAVTVKVFEASSYKDNTSGSESI
jgi:hypothetical protein